MFGFLLQKGQVTKYRVIVGQPLLRDFTVLKTMLTAVVAGGIGLYILKAIAPTLALPPRRKGRSTRCSASRGGAYGYFSKTILATATDGRTGNGSYKRHATMA